MGSRETLARYPSLGSIPSRSTNSKKGYKMNTYHKIQTVYKRDPDTKFKTLLDGQFSLPELEYLANNDWEWTEKIDGTNIRVVYNEHYLEFKGKTDKAEFYPGVKNRLEELFSFSNFIEMFIDTDAPVTFYGEAFGKGIQKGDKYLDYVDFILFDVKIGEWWLKRKDVNDIAKKFNINSVPTIGYGTLYEAIEKTRKGFNSQWGDFIAEGIVARPTVELRARSGQRIITKIKYKDFIR